MAWWSIAVARWLEPAGASASAAIITGALFLAPLLLYLAVNSIARAYYARDQRFLLEDQRNQQSQLVTLVSQRALSLFRERPLLGLALVTAAGILVARHPGVVTILAQALSPAEED